MQAAVTDDMAALAAEFPGWHIWRSRSLSGRETGWNATRQGRPARAAGAPGILAAGSAEVLRSLLVQQEALRRDGAA
jgi:hypothetical protein